MNTLTDINLLENFTSGKKSEKKYKEIHFEEPVSGPDSHRAAPAVPDYFDFLRDDPYLFYDSLPLGYVTLDEKGIIKNANQAAAEILDVEKHRLIDTDFIDFIQKGDQEKIRLDRTGLSDPAFRSFDVRLEQQPLSWVRINVVNDENLWCYSRQLQLILTDINDLKHVELENTKLQYQLQQAQKMEAIGSLSSGIVHDFNNILHPIIGNLEMLIDDAADDGKFQTTLENILKGANRASGLVKQILNFSHQVTSEIMPVKIQPIIGEVLKLSRSTMSAKIKIIKTIDNDCGTVMVDPTHIYQIAMNLITNAFHAMGNCDGILDVTLKEVEVTGDFPGELTLNPGTYACLGVADTGYGIDDTIKNKIFEPCFTTKRRGTGLGLSVICNIVKKYGGGIDFSSEPGKGSLFQVYIPLYQAS